MVVSLYRFGNSDARCSRIKCGLERAALLREDNASRRTVYNAVENTIRAEDLSAYEVFIRHNG